MIDLSGSGVTHLLIPKTTTGRLVSAKIIYTEASSADAGITITIGASNSVALHFTGTTVVSQSQWTTTALTVLDNRIGFFDDDLVVVSAGGKTGAGEIQIAIEYYDADGATITND